MSLLLLTAITSFHSCSDAYRGRTYATEEGSYATEEGPTLHHQDHQDDKEEINLLLIQRWIGKEPPGPF